MTTSLADWLAALAARGVELWFEGDRLRFRAPKGALAPEQRGELGARRSEVLAHLRAEAAGRQKTLPLSFSQQSLWFLHQQAPRSTAYHIAMTARLLSAVDVGGLRHAVQALVDRHAILRTTYGFEDGAPCQRVAGVAAAAFEVRAVPGLPDAELRAAVLEEHRRPFDLEQGPVLRASLFSRGPEDHVLLITVHHIAADGWSLLMLFEELRKLYAEAIGGPAAGLARPGLEYADYSAWQQQMLAGAEGERLWAYWQKKLAPPRARLELPTDHPRPAVQSLRGESFPLELGAATTAALKELARQEGATPFVVLLATFQAFLFRLTGSEDVIVGTPTFARSKAEFMPIVGDFVNSVPLRGALRPDLSFRALVAQLRRTVHEALDAQELPLPLLVKRLSPDRDPSRAPLFDTFFLLQRFDQFRELEALLAEGGVPTVIESGGLRLGPFPLPQQEGQFELALQMLEQGGVLHAVFKYSTDLFEEDTVRKLASDYLALVAALERDPDVALGALPTPARAAPARALLERLRQADIRLFLEGDRLRVSAPKGAMTEELKALVASNRDLLVAALRTPEARAPRPIPRQGEHAALPLSPAQQRLWLLARMAPDDAADNLALGVRLRGPLDPGLLRRALDELVSRHEPLRTRLREQGDAPALEILPPAPAMLTLEVVDLGSLPVEGREAEARRRAGEACRARFDLGQGAPVRFLLVRLAPDDHRLIIVAHQAVADRASLAIAAREIAELHAALSAGRAPALEPLAMQHVDHAAWQGDRLHAGERAADLAYWKQQLAGAPPVLELPSDRSRPAAPSLRAGRLPRRFSPEVQAALAELSAKREVAPEVVLLAAWQLLLHRSSGQEDLVVGFPVPHRAHTRGLVGPFADHVALRSRLGGDPSFAGFLAETERTLAAARAHEALPLDILVEALGLRRSADHAPIFQVELALRPAEPGLEIFDVEPASTRLDLALEVSEDGAAVYTYAADLFDESTIARLHGHLEHLLAAAARDPEARAVNLPLLTAAEERQLAGWNETGLEHDRGRCVHHLLEAAARATPDAVAVVAGDARVTYRALDERANRLAHLLARRGVKPGALVAVCVDRTEDMPIAVAAVLKTGAAYVPVDPTHPAERLRYTVEDAAVACAITLARFAPLLAGAGAPLVLLDEVEAELAALPATPPAAAVTPTDRAYVIYTSGSTGRPKGVEVEHRNVVAFLEAMRREPGLVAGDVLLAVTTLSFDIAGLELWLPLMAGARIVIASRTDVIDGERLIDLLAEHQVTVMQATPATWRIMIDAGWSGKRDLKVLCGGEALPRDLAAGLLERVGELWNVYGPTETTVWSTVSRITDLAAPITIGRPIANTRIYVLEPSGLLAPIGVPGELCIGGEGVARGYHDRPELTAEKFVVLTFAPGRGERAYRTGDVARLRADGTIDFLGRRDHQVKVRGYRIELGEIEAVLATHAGIKECVVAVREDTPGDQRLTGYVVSAGDAGFDAEAARATLRTKLPEYMIPGGFVVLPALPLTPNGKIDRKALPAPTARAEVRADDEAEALMTPAQRRVAAIWREVLGVSRVGLHDNFFDSGGHSLVVVKLHAALKREFARGVELVELFQWTTVAAQAAMLSAPAATPDGALRRAQARAARQTHG